MGIINVTPDSFYDGGAATSEKKILQQAEKMLNQGATFLDVGGYSSRPGALHISTKEEKGRVLPAVKAIVKKFPKALVSIDTFRAEVAHAAINEGASLINDISAGLLDTKMLQTAAKLQVPYIMMHMRGTPQTMAKLNNYKNVVTAVLHYFSERIAAARAVGINDVIVDPGFGFSKTTGQGFALLRSLQAFNGLGCPLLVGVSRKSMIYKTLHTAPAGALNGTTVLHTLALQKGAHILRVHDVKEAVQCIKLLQMANAKTV